MTAAPFELSGRRIWVAGHTGMVGSALVRRLAREDCEIVTVPRASLDLRDQSATLRWMADIRPDAVILAAARVGGIQANMTYPADFLADNLLITSNVIQGAHRAGVAKLLFLGSSCIYPRLADQPIVESALLGGALEPTNEWYAVAKIAGLKLCAAYRRQHGCDFISAMPTNLYGPGDTFELETSHVVPALMRRAHEARLAGADRMVVWGSGRPLREFLHVDDCADACLHLLRVWSDESHVNVGSGEEISIADLAAKIGEVVGFRGDLVFDASRPDGTPRKRLDVSRLASLGWTARIPLDEGLVSTYRAFREAVAT